MVDKEKEGLAIKFDDSLESICLNFELVLVSWVGDDDYFGIYCIMQIEIAPEMHR